MGEDADDTGWRQATLSEPWERRARAGRDGLVVGGSVGETVRTADSDLDTAVDRLRTVTERP